MAESMSDDQMRGEAITDYWSAECKDCAAQRRMRSGASRGKHGKAIKTATNDAGFEYSGSWADRALELGQTRSDRCEHHRRLHREAIRALSVPYVALDVIGQVRDRQNPTGPLGGLGPLPKLHVRNQATSDLNACDFGMSDKDILRILEGLKDKRVAVIEAGTGTGKSTFMPFRLMNPPKGAAFRPIDDGQIVVTEPRRYAATSVATYVGETLVFNHDTRTCNEHIGPGFPVGYQVMGDKRWDMACDLIYVTDGTMINWVRDGSLARIGMVIVDEAHERSMNIDIILAQLREKVKEYKHLRVIITSATIDRNFFIDYFGGEKHVFHYSVPAKKSFGFGVPLFADLNLDSSVIKNGLTLDTEVGPVCFPGWSGFGPEHPGYPPDNLAHETEKYAALHRKQVIPKESWPKQMPSALAEQVVAIAEGTEFGDILGFLPTTATINEAINLIKRGLKNPGDFDIYPLLRSTDEAMSEAATAARKRGEKRKIVISSNLAETSLTVSGVRYVVDSGLICQSEWNADIASGGLPKLPHSQSGVRQRWGRVGRNAPGWVFPLYTIDQFLSLARDTPPESTRANLEEFCTRLISSGLDPETAILPGNFESTGYRPDEFAQKAAENFTKELRRASKKLRASGLIDADGDLTDLGREIERYSGTASEALAIVLGDRLACLHEVALGIAVIAGGNLYGGKDRVLGTDFGWPPEWRLRANACHRALSAGCEDDLELALRIAFLYKAADDGSQWCRTWWVNQGVLDDVLKEVDSIIDNLSAAMKKEAARPFQSMLLPRARAALTQAFKDQIYRKSDGGSFMSCVDNKTATGPARSLVPPNELVLALNRIEKTRAPGQIERQINHYVKVDERFIDPLTSIDVAAPDDFDVLLRLADRGSEQLDSQATERDVLGYVRATLPIGCVASFDLSIDLDGVERITASRVHRTPFLRPGSESSRRTLDDDNGYYAEWDFKRRKDAVLDEEEIANLPTNRRTNLRNQELNDEAKGGDETIPYPVRSPLTFENRTTHARMLFGAGSPTPNMAYLVSDYAIEDGRVVVLLEPFNEAQKSVDPACHDTTTCFEEISVRFLGVAQDADSSFLRFRATDTHERFDVEDKFFFALDRYVAAWAQELPIGMTMKAIVIAPEPGQRTITARPYLRAALDKAGRVLPAKPGQVNRLYDAAITTLPNAYGKLEVRLEQTLEPGGAVVGAVLPVAWVGDDRGIPIEIGTKLLTGYVTAPTDDVALRQVTPELEALAKKSGGCLALKEDKAIALKPLTLTLARQLAEQKTDLTLENWLVAVSKLFDASQYIKAKVAMPSHLVQIEGSRAALALLQSERQSFQDRYDVRVDIENSGRITIMAKDESTLADAETTLSALANKPYYEVRVLGEYVRRIIGKGRQSLHELQTKPGISWLWLADDVVHIVAESADAAHAGLEAVRRKASNTTGYITFPHQSIHDFFKIKGIAREYSHVRCSKTDNDGVWRIEGNTAANLEHFAAICRLKVPNLEHQIDTLIEPEILYQQHVESEIAATRSRSEAFNKRMKELKEPFTQFQETIERPPTQPTPRTQEAGPPRPPREASPTPEPTVKRPRNYEELCLGPVAVRKLTEISKLDFVLAVFGGTPVRSVAQQIADRWKVRIDKIDAETVCISGGDHRAVESAISEVEAWKRGSQI